MASCGGLNDGVDAVSGSVTQKKYQRVYIPSFKRQSLKLFDILQLIHMHI